MCVFPYSPSDARRLIISRLSSQELRSQAPLHQEEQPQRQHRQRHRRWPRCWHRQGAVNLLHGSLRAPHTHVSAAIGQTKKSNFPGSLPGKLHLVISASETAALTGSTQDRHSTIDRRGGYTSAPRPFSPRRLRTNLRYGTTLSTNIHSMHDAGEGGGQLDLQGVRMAWQPELG